MPCLFGDTWCFSGRCFFCALPLVVVILLLLVGGVVSPRSKAHFFQKAFESYFRFPFLFVVYPMQTPPFSRPMRKRRVETYFSSTGARENAFCLCLYCLSFISIEAIFFLVFFLGI